jgi:hypothetical protein
MADKNVRVEERQKEDVALKQLGRSGQPDSAEKEAKKRTNDGNATVEAGSSFHSRGEQDENSSAQSLTPLHRASAGGVEHRLGIKEMIFVGEQINSAELQPMVCLLEAWVQRLLKSAPDGDELRTSTNMRALSSSIASGRAEVNSIRQRENWPKEIREEVMKSHRIGGPGGMPSVLRTVGGFWNALGLGLVCL